MRICSTSALLVALICTSMYGQEQMPIAPKILEKTLLFPSPVQWELNSGNSNADISLVGMAWGLAAAPEMLAKTNEQ